MIKNIGFIGCGNMGGSIVRGYLKSHPDKASNVILFDMDSGKPEKIRAEWKDVKISESVSQLCKNSDLVLLAVKPNQLEELLKEIGPLLEKTLVVSIAAGVKISYLESKLPFEKPRIVRVMPNVAAMVNEAMSAMWRNKNVSEGELETAKEIFDSVGKSIVLDDEELIHAVIAASGSSPAYVFMFIEALADAAVSEGLKREDAMMLSAQAVLGSAAMVLETGIHPGALKDMVCSPAGTSIEAVKTLEEKGFRGAVISGAEAAALQSYTMSWQMEAKADMENEDDI